MKKCYCREILEAEFGKRPYSKLYVHLSGCPEDSYSKEWKKMNWWKKLWNISPEKLYFKHYKVFKP